MVLQCCVMRQCIGYDLVTITTTINTTNANTNTTPQYTTEKQSRATITCLSTEDSVLNTLRLKIWNKPVKQANPLESGGCQNTNHTYPTTKIYQYDAYNMICYRTALPSTPVKDTRAATPLLIMDSPSYTQQQHN